MKEPYDILCIGTALMDSVIRCFDPKPVSATGYRAQSGSLHTGGEAVNASIAAAKLGLKAGILCFLGTDTAGKIIETELKSSGVDTGMIVHSKDHPTPVTTMFVAEDGTRRSVANEAHRYNFRPEQYYTVEAAAKAVILGSLFRAPFDDPEAVSSIVEISRENGAVIIADTKLPNFRKLTLEDFKDSLPRIDYITPNEDEAKFLTGKADPEEMAEVFLGYGVQNVIIKLGPEGCYYRDPKKAFYSPAFPIDAVDATGAGDHFIAGFASEILRGAAVEDALRFANACGAVCTTEAGASAALKDRQQVLGFMRRRL